MKLRITFKDPDGVDKAIRQAVEDSLWAERPELYEDEFDALRELRTEKIYDIIAKFLYQNKYITVEFDTKENTCIVLPADEV